MKREVETKFYEFNQSNSGGSYDVNDNVCHRVIIEAIDNSHAVSIFEPMIEDQSGSCPCCGDRWYQDEPDVVFLGVNDTVEGYCQMMADKYGLTSPDAIIHFIDGTKKEVFKNT